MALCAETERYFNVGLEVNILKCPNASPGRIVTVVAENFTHFSGLLSL